MTSVLAVIPARGGSKRVDRKNIREVGGEPLLKYTIEQAESSDLISESIVSTEDKEIMEVAEQCGGNVPFQRPEELATDTSSSSSVVSHALSWYSDQGNHFDMVCLLQVTSPLRTSEDIDESIVKLSNSDADALISITSYSQPPQYALTNTEDGYLRECSEPSLLFNSDYVREQDLEKQWFPNGAIYLVKTDAWESEEQFYLNRTIGHRMPPKRSLQIDEEWELEMIDSYMKSKK